MLNSKPKQGFTLIELLISISIIGIISGVIITSAAAIQKNARDSQRKTDLSTLQTDLQHYYADQNYYPNLFDVASRTALNNCTGGRTNPQCSVSRTYLINVPTDPSSATPYRYFSGRNSTGADPACDNNDQTLNCQYYWLCAKLEGPNQQSLPASSKCPADYNYQVTPL